MGACASMFKTMKEEEGAAPLPEPAKEEVTATPTPTVAEAADVKAEEVVAEEEGDKPQSLGTLLNEDGEEVKEISTEEKEIKSSTEVEKQEKEESKEESLPVSDAPAEVTKAN